MLKIDDILGMSKKTQRKIGKASNKVSDFSQFMIFLTPSIATFIIPINMARIVALLPTLLPGKFLAYLGLIVQFEENDLLTQTYAKKLFYSDEYLTRKVFVPRNRSFQFVSIYPRIRGLKIILRVMVNILYIFLVQILKNDSKSKKLSTRLKTRKARKMRHIFKFMVKGIISLDHINIVANYMFMGTSVFRGVSLFDFFVILLDVFNLVFFQMELLRIYFLYKGRPSKEITDPVHKNMVYGALYLQNGKKTVFPVSFVINGV